MSGDRKPEEPDIFSGVPGEAPEPDDFWPPDREEDYLEPRIRTLKESWQPEARQFVSDLVARGLNTADIHLELDRWQALRQDFPPKRKKTGGRSSAASARWCDAILKLSTPNDEEAFRAATSRVEEAAFDVLREREVKDPAFKDLRDTPWIGCSIKGKQYPPLLKNIREAAKRRWNKGR